jgi:hypothetical protein
MYRGVGLPQLVSEELNKTITLPKPLKDKRKETFKDEKKVYTNINGKKIPMRSKFRFIGEYEFGLVTTDILDDVINLHVNQSVCKFIPHSDYPFINYHVVLKECTPEYFKGLVTRDSLKMKVESVDYVYKIPTLDNMIGGCLLTRVGVLNGSMINLTGS